MKPKPKKKIQKKITVKNEIQHSPGYKDLLTQLKEIINMYITVKKPAKEMKGLEKLKKDKEKTLREMKVLEDKK